MLTRERRITHALFVLPGLMLYCFQTVIPVVLGAFYSVTNWNGVSKSFSFIGVQNYLRALSDIRFRRSMSFSLRYTFLLIVCVTALALFLGLLLNVPIRGRTFFRAVYFFPAVISMITIGLIFSQFYSRGMASLGEILGISWMKKSILSSPHTAIYGVLIANVWKSAAIPTVLVLAGLQAIPEEINESAKLDGASSIQLFLHITVPFLLPIISAIVMLTLKEGLMVYDYVMALTQGGPAGSTESITMMIYRLGFEEMKFSYSIALSILVSLVIGVASVLQIRLNMRKQVY